jgi:hypothetical protein
MEMKTVKVSIKGISPLLMNRPDILEMSDKAKERLSGKDVMEQQFITKQYRNADGKLYIPDTHLKGAIVEAGKGVKVTGKGKATYSKIVGYAVIVKPFEILHEKTKLEKHIVLAVNPNTKGRNPLCRPMLPEWFASFEIEYDNDEIPEEALKTILDKAGKYVGIGDWRPAKKGTFGRFIVTEFK